MRSYIFTQNEREIIRRFFDGSVSRSDPNLMNILSRVRNFKNLASDVELYRMLREAVTAASTQPSLNR
jgi:hypothetical protein